MPKQKPEHSEKTDLEARVDAMMDVNADGITDSQPIDIFAGQMPEAPGAPPVPGVRVHKPAPINAIAGEPTVATNPVVSEEPLTDDVKVPNVEIDTPQTDEAIADIVAQEADEVLAAQDAGIERAIETADNTDTVPAQKHGHPIFWFVILLLVIVAAAAAFVLTRPGLKLPFGL